MQVKLRFRRIIDWQIIYNINDVSDKAVSHILLQIRCKAVEWHPDVATQMVLASEDDRYPVIQVCSK